MTCTNSSSNKKKLLLIPICIILFAGIIAAYLHIYQEKKNMEAKQQYLDRLSVEFYDSVFFSMYPIDNYSEEDFFTYRGLTTPISSYVFSDLAEIPEFLDTALISDNNLSTVYLGLDPYAIWTTSKENQNNWDADLSQYLISYIDAYPEITFEVLLPYPSMEYWTDAKEEKVNTILTTYRTLVCSLAPYSNVYTFFVGGEHWLIANSGNYEGDFNTNYNVSKHLMLTTFCDGNLRITDIDADIVFDNFKTMIQEEKNSPATYPDLSKWQIVFFGDSVIGNYKGSASVPGVVNGLSDASAYNFAIGGTSATQFNESNNTFIPVVNQFLSGELTVTQDDTTFHGDRDSDDRLCFVIHYGLNDYFTGQQITNPDDLYDENTYTGALRTGIRQLQDAYPDATILLLTPPFCSYFSNGTEINSNAGGTLTDYVDAVIRVATEMNVDYLDNYTGLGINADNHTDYLADGCHLNETGRFLAATHIIDFLDTK